jgi:hypothetical protein
VVEALVERLRVRSRRDAQGRSELHALAESQRGPFPPLPVCKALSSPAVCSPLHTHQGHSSEYADVVLHARGNVRRGLRPTGASGQPRGTNPCASC